MRHDGYEFDEIFEALWVGYVTMDKRSNERMTFGLRALRALWRLNLAGVIAILFMPGKILELSILNAILFHSATI